MSTGLSIILPSWCVSSSRTAGHVLGFEDRQQDQLVVAGEPVDLIHQVDDFLPQPPLCLAHPTTAL